MSTLKATNLQNASAASPAIVLAADGSATAQLSSINGGPLAGSRNRIINGDMRIDARNAGAAVTINGNFVFASDRHYSGGVPSGGTFTAQRSTVAPAGFSNSLLCTVTGVDSSLASGDYYFPLLHKIEGFNVADLAWGTSSAVSITVSFWCRGSVTGTYAVACRNSVSDRSYIGTFSISAANTWEFKSILIPGDQSGTWRTDNGSGIELSIGAIGGSSVQGASGAWSASNVYTTSGCVNWMATNGATFYITGVQLEPGTVATPFERIDYSESLRRCQRYYQRIQGDTSNQRSVGNGLVGTSSAIYRVNIPIKVQMRAAPTLSSSGLTGYDGGVNPAVSVGTNYSTGDQISADFTGGSGFTVGRVGAILTGSASTSFFDASAEL